MIKGKKFYGAVYRESKDGMPFSLYKNMEEARTHLKPDYPHLVEVTVTKVWKINPDIVEVEE